jgi:hypothetical protein
MALVTVAASARRAIYTNELRSVLCGDEGDCDDEGILSEEDESNSENLVEKGPERFNRHHQEHYPVSDLQPTAFAPRKS